MPSTQTCRISGQQFIVTDEDEAFCRDKGFGIPDVCPSERMRQRLVWRNERGLHYRNCDATGELILAAYSAYVAFPVYQNEVWWSDRFDPLTYGRDFDFSLTFFENYKLLSDVVPRQALDVATPKMFNSDFCNCCSSGKDNYYVFNSFESERCLYCKGAVKCFDCVDCYKVFDCEACYESCNCANCSFSVYLYDSKGCDECYFSRNLIGCMNCFGCANLHNKQYYFLNKQLTKEEYEKQFAEVMGSHSLSELKQTFWEFQKQFPVRYMEGIQNENVQGDYVNTSKGCHECFDCVNLESCRYCTDLNGKDQGTHHNMDVSYFGYGVRHSYGCVAIGTEAENLNFCIRCHMGANDGWYSQNCMNGCLNFFGCNGLIKQKYCIFNKQYTVHEYTSLRERIVAHMKETGEWGQFWPASFFYGGYNETVAQEYLPLDKSGAEALGYTWFKDTKQESNGGAREQGDLTLDDSILEKTLVCEETGKEYRIVKPELNFYRKMKLPVPTLSPNERHFARMETRKPRQIWERQCANCKQEISTSYAPERPEKVLCEKCYLKVVD